MKESTQEVFDICNACRFSAQQVCDTVCIDPAVLHYFIDTKTSEEYVSIQFGDIADYLDEACEIAETRAAREYIAETRSVVIALECDAFTHLDAVRRG